MTPAATLDVSPPAAPGAPRLNRLGRLGRLRHWPLLVPAVVVSALIVVLHRWNQYTSDSVAQQSLVRTWLDAGHGTAYAPSDTWILKLPLYLGVESLPVPPGTRLVLEVVALNASCFALLAAAAWWLARAARPGAPAPRLLDVAAPLLWLATLGGELGTNRMQPNYRNIELGLSFLALAVAARYLDENAWPVRSRRTAAGAVVIAAGLALLWVDDLYFALLTGVPFALSCGVWFAVRRRGESRFLVAAGVVVASVALIAPLMWVLDRIGLRVLPGAGGTELGAGDLARHLRLLGPATAAQLGLADADPGSLVPGTGTALSPLAAVLTGALVMVAVLAGLGLTWFGWRQRRLLPAFLGLHWVIVAAGFCVSAKVSQVAHGRYLILAWFDLAVGLAVALPILAARRGWAASAVRVLSGVLIASTVLNVIGAIITAPGVGAHQWDRRPAAEAGPASPATEAAVQDAVAATGLRRGYAEFWSANLTLYRSGGRVSVNAVRCVAGQLRVENWLTDTARRTAPSPGTFLIVQPASPAFSGCPLPVLWAQLGTPVRELPAGPGAFLLVFAGDIGPRITPWDLPQS